MGYNRTGKESTRKAAHIIGERDKSSGPRRGRTGALITEQTGV